MVTQAPSDPYRTRLFLMLCTLPQAVGLYFALLVPKVVGEVMAVGYLPEGTQLPLGTRWVMALSPISQSGQERWDFDYQLDVAFFAATAWIASVCVMIWWTRDRTEMIRRWVVVSSVAWPLISGWIWLAATGLGVPLIPISGGMNMNPPATEPAGGDWWSVTKIAAYCGLAAVLVIAFRRDGKRRIG